MADKLGADINKNGRVTVKLKLTAPAEKEGGKEMELYKELIADTGNPKTTVPAVNFKPYGASHKIRGGRQFVTPSGKIINELTGVRMTAEVEKHGGGDKENRTCDNVAVHALSEEEAKKEYEGCVGLLGMDQFDSLKADPVKSADGKKAYLAKRV